MKFWTLFHTILVNYIKNGCQFHTLISHTALCKKHTFQTSTLLSHVLMNQNWFFFVNLISWYTILKMYIIIAVRYSIFWYFRRHRLRFSVWRPTSGTNNMYIRTSVNSIITHKLCIFWVLSKLNVNVWQQLYCCPHTWLINIQVSRIHYISA